MVFYQDESVVLRAEKPGAELEVYDIQRKRWTGWGPPGEFMKRVSAMYAADALVEWGVPPAEARAAVKG